MDEGFSSNPYKKDEKKSLAEVIISQIDVCRKEFSKEMKKGFQTQTVIQDKIINITIPDQRLTCIQCTKSLYDLLIFYFDKDFNTSYEKIKKKLDSSCENSMKIYISQEPNQKLRAFVEKNKVLPITPLAEKSHQQLITFQAELYRELFQGLVLLFKRKNELSGKRTLGYKD